MKPSGRVYPHWHQMGRVTGSMTCSDPNVVGIPRGPLRSCVVAQRGHVLVRGDYSQSQLRIAAALSGDTEMIRAFRSGSDFHAEVARRVLGTSAISAQDRQLAKELSFGPLFGQGINGLIKTVRSNYGIELSFEDAVRHRGMFQTAFPGLAAWQRRTHGKWPVREPDLARSTSPFWARCVGTGQDCLSCPRLRGGRPEVCSSAALASTC